MAAIVDVSGYVFTAMHSLRTDRSFSTSGFNLPDPTPPPAKKPIGQSRAAAAPACSV